MAVLIINPRFLTILASQGIDFLLSGENKVHLSSCDGKIICLYFSANWCRPCKTFAPQLVQLYNNLRAEGKKLEIVLVSIDRDEEGFKEQLKSMPWLAVPFDVELHRQLSDIYGVCRIPSFVPLASDGMSIEEDLIELVKDYGSEAFPLLGGEGRN